MTVLISNMKCPPNDLFSFQVIFFFFVIICRNRILRKNTVKSGFKRNTYYRVGKYHLTAHDSECEKSRTSTDQLITVAVDCNVKMMIVLPCAFLSQVFLFFLWGLLISLKISPINYISIIILCSLANKNKSQDHVHINGD